MALSRNTWIEVNEKKRTYFFGDKLLKVLNVARFKISTHGRHYLQKKNGQYLVVAKGWLGIKVDGELVGS